MANHLLAKNMNILTPSTDLNTEPFNPQGNRQANATVSVQINVKQSSRPPKCTAQLQEQPTSETISSPAPHMLCPRTELPSSPNCYQQASLIDPKMVAQELSLKQSMSKEYWQVSNKRIQPSAYQLQHLCETSSYTDDSLDIWHDHFTRHAFWILHHTNSKCQHLFKPCQHEVPQSTPPMLGSDPLSNQEYLLHLYLLELFYLLLQLRRVVTTPRPHGYTSQVLKTIQT